MNADYFQTIFEDLPTAIIILDRELRIKTANGAFYDLLGFSEKIEGMPVLKLLPDSALQKQAEDIIRLDDGRREMEIYLPTNSDRKILKVVMKRVKRPAIDGVIILVEDVSERAALEEHLLHAEKHFAMGQLAASLIHEIGNPLGIMKSTMSFLHNHLTKMGEEVKVHFQVVLENMDRMHELLKDLSEFSKPKRDRFGFYDISSCVSQTVRFVEKECERGGIGIETSFEKGLPTVYCNPHRLKQVLLNLVKNAMEAMPKGGELSIAARRTMSPDGQKMMIEVADTGTGVSEGDLKNIFRPFYTTKKDGTGLGLFITRNIILEHDGAINVRSRKGFGTTFSVALPVLEKGD